MVCVPYLSAYRTCAVAACAARVAVNLEMGGRDPGELENSSWPVAAQAPTATYQVDPGRHLANQEMHLRHS